MPDDELLPSISSILQFMGVCRTVFYKCHTLQALEAEGIIFSRPGKYGKIRRWSYKRLIMSFLVKHPDFFMKKNTQKKQ